MSKQRSRIPSAPIVKARLPACWRKKYPATSASDSSIFAASAKKCWGCRTARASGWVEPGGSNSVRLDEVFRRASLEHIHDALGRGQHHLLGGPVGHAGDVGHQQRIGRGAEGMGGQGRRLGEYVAGRPGNPPPHQRRGQGSLWHNSYRNDSSAPRRTLHCAFIAREHPQQTNQREYLQPATAPTSALHPRRGVNLEVFFAPLLFF